LSLLLIVAAFATHSQEPFPSRPITVVVPFPPGGVADIVARPVADAMGRYLNNPMVVENKAGAGGGIGMGFVAKAKPDGYTLLLALSSISILPEADKVTGRAPLYQTEPVRADRPVHRRSHGARRTRRQSVENARRVRRRRPQASGRDHLRLVRQLRHDARAMEMFAGSAGIKLLHVPYTGAGPAVVALLGGNVDAIASGPSTVIPHLKAGKVRVLASWGEVRLVALPDVPTLKESGYDAVFFQWAALFAPAGTPEPALAKLREAAARRRCRSALRFRDGHGRDADPVSRRSRAAALLGRRCEAVGRSGEARRKDRVAKRRSPG
jgi:tripartite-type tricarboxylate transporter receptor subunit TctC